MATYMKYIAGSIVHKVSIRKYTEYVIGMMFYMYVCLYAVFLSIVHCTWDISTRVLAIKIFSVIIFCNYIFKSSYIVG